MQRTLRNAYKRTDLFHCAYTPHHRFEDDVSVFHVMMKRRCFPSGCVQFRWRCKKFDKGQTCPRGYQFIGRKCEGCKFFYENKETYHSELKVGPEEYEAFRRELTAWEDWLSEVRGREVEFRATIHTVKPHMKAYDGSSRRHLRFVGWLLSFREAIIGYDRLCDPVYVHVSRSQMSREGFAAGMEIDALGIFDLDRGRPLLAKLHRIEVLRGTPSVPSETDALVAATSGTTFAPPPEKCMLCERGVLVDVEGEKSRPGSPNRCLHCLEGIQSPGDCLFHLRDALAGARRPAVTAAKISP